MLVGICGSICSGRSSVRDHLVERHGFQGLNLKENDEAYKSSQLPKLHASDRRPNAREFKSVDDMLDYATRNWQTDFVTTSIHSASAAATLAHRPFFLLIHVDAPLSIRFNRYLSLRAMNPAPAPTLGEFLQANDSHLYTSPAPLATLAHKAHLHLLNTAPSLQVLRTQLDILNIPNPDRLRPSWDHYFMTLASLAARRSNCMRRQVGCVLIRSSRVISTGYNGTPRHLLNCLSGGCTRCNTSPSQSGGAALSTCLCLHAEENALLEAGRERIGEGAVLYCNTCPCLTCSIKIVQVGIAEVVFSQSYYMDAEAAKVFGEAGVKLRQFSPPVGGLVVLGGEENVVVLEDGKR